MAQQRSIRPADASAAAPLPAPLATTQTEAAPAGAAGSRHWALRSFESLTDAQYRWYMGAMLGWQAAMNMQLIVRGYLVYVLTGSYAALGVIALASALPMLTLSLVGGVLADRLPRKRVLQTGQTASVLMAASIAALLFADRLSFWHLFAASMIQGTTMALMMPSRQAMIPEVVGHERLMNAVSLNAAGMNLMRLIAPALAGFLIHFAGAQWVYVLMGGLYLWSAIGIIPVRAGAGRSDANRKPQGGARDLLDGLAYVLRTPTMLVILASSFLMAALAMPYIQILPGYVEDVFDAGADRLGLLVSISAVGSLLGALVLAALPARRRGLMLLGSAALLGGGLILFASTDTYVVGIVFLFFVGIGTAGRQALSQVLLQTYVDNDYRGRVMALFMTQVSLMQLGTFITGVASDEVGVQNALTGLGALLLVACVGFLLFVPQLRRLQ